MSDDSINRNYLNHDKGIMSWIFTLDHKRIAMMYMAGVLTALPASTEISFVTEGEDQRLLVLELVDADHNQALRVVAFRPIKEMK